MPQPPPPTPPGGGTDQPPAGITSPNRAARRWWEVQIGAAPFLVVLLAISLIVLLSVSLGAPDFLSRLREADYARGLITFFIAVTTIVLGLVLVIASVLGQSEGAQPISDEHFRRAREVFTALTGVLGTIVGFYFGATDRKDAALQVAPLRFTEQGRRVVTFASGGVPQYRYTVSVKGQADPPAAKVSAQGWIDEAVPPGGEVTVEVTDQAGRRTAVTGSPPQGGPNREGPTSPAPGPDRAGGAVSPPTPR